MGKRAGKTLRIVFTCAACHRVMPTHPGLRMANWTCAECQAAGAGRTLHDLEQDIRAAHLGERPWVETVPHG